MSATGSLSQANRFFLQRHGLIARESLDPLALAGRICGLHAQVASTACLSLWSRLDGFQVADLERALYEERSLVRMWVMRGTLHIIPREDLPLYIGAASEAAMRRWRSWSKTQPEGIPWDRLKEEVRAALQAGPLTRAELLVALEKVDLPVKLSWPGLLHAYCVMGYLVHARPTGSWYHYGKVRFAWREDWTGLSDDDIVPTEEARGRLFLRYLGAYGPATVHDYAYWAALKVGEARQALKAVRDALTEVRLEGDNRSFWLRAEDLPALLDTDPQAPLPPRLLPRFDTLLLGHKDKERYLDPEEKGQVFRPLADVAGTLLLGGRVAGTWKYRLPKGRLKDVQLEPFGLPSVEVPAELEDEVERLRAWVG